MIKLIIFDCYGVVLSRGYPDTAEALSKKYNISKDKLFKVMYVKYFNQAAVGKITQNQAWQKTIDDFNLPMTARELHDFHIGLLKLNKRNFYIVKNLRKNYKTLLLSKNTRSQLAATRKKFPQLWTNFDKVINAWELGLPKASKKTMNVVSKMFKVKPSDILYIDDQKKNLVVAKKMGVKTFFYQNFKQFKKELDRYLK